MVLSQGWKWIAAGSMVLSACASNPRNEAHVAAPTAPVAEAQNLSPDGREPAEITRVAEGEYRVDWCGNASDAGKKYELIMGENPPPGGRLDQNGCLRFTFRNNRVSPGTNIVYRIEGQNRASETVPGSRGGQQPAPGPRPPAPTPPQPSLQSVDIGRVQNEAENRARCTANAVVGLYGRVESYRYNFSRGFRSGLQIYNFSNLGDLRRSPEYQQGISAGERDGAMQGRRAGMAAGEADGVRQAVADVRGRYYAIVDRETPPDLSRNIPASGFEGLRADIQEPRGINYRISDLEAEYRAHMMRQSFGYEGDVMRWDSWRNEWTLGYIYQHDFSNELVRGWYRDDWAFDMYRNRRFSRCADGVDYYDRIRNSSLYSNASQAQTAYRNAFKREYDRVIDSKWNQAVREQNPAAFNEGQNYGWRVAREHARDVGYTTGYRLAFTEESRMAYDERFADSYTGAFDQEVRKYEQGTIAVLQEAQVVTEGGNGRSHLVVGMPLSVNILRAFNVGRQPGEVPLTLAGQHVAAPVRKNVAFRASASLPEDSRLVGPLGTIATTVAPNSPVDIAIDLGGHRVSDRFVMDWKALIRVVPTVDGPVQGTQIEYLRAHMAKEIQDNGGGFFQGNPWESEREDKLLKQAANVIQTMAPQEKAVFRPMVTRLRTEMGQRPSGIFGRCNAACRAWNSLDGWLKKME